MTEQMRIVVTATADGEFQDAAHAENLADRLVEVIEEWDSGEGWDVDHEVTSIEELPVEVPGAPTTDSHAIAVAAIEKLDRVREACSELKRMAPRPGANRGVNATFFAWAKIAEALQEDIP